jgi:hypothetical protein
MTPRNKKGGSDASIPVVVAYRRDHVDRDGWWRVRQPRRGPRTERARLQQGMRK